MKKILLALTLTFFTSSALGQVVYYYDPPVIVQPAPMVPVYNYVPTPEASNIYSPPGYPTDVPVAASGNCAMYVDPYDLFGQIFGGADLVQSCWVRP